MDYLNNDLILHKIIVFLLLLLIYSLLSNLIYWKNLNWIKNNLPFGEYINFILVKLNGDNSIINIIIYLFNFNKNISCYYTTYYWYWFVHDFDYISYVYVRSII